MKAKMIWANLGVKDLNRTQQFYQALGFQLNGQPNEQLVSFLFGENNFIIHFFLKDAPKAGSGKDNRSAGCEK